MLPENLFKLASSPSISVIIPVYNAERYLEKMLNSLAGQTFSNAEFICVDDGSSDKSIEILQKFEAADKRFKIIRQNNKYAGVARNHGLKYAKGKYVIFIDSDDLLKPSMLQKLYTRAEQTSADIVLCKITKYNEESNHYEEANYSLKTYMIPNEIFSVVDIPDKIFQITIPAPFNKFYRHDFLLRNKIKFQEIHNTNDMLFSYLSLVLADRITYLDMSLYIYRFNAVDNLTANRSRNPYCFIEAVTGLKEELISRDKYSLVRQSYIELGLNQYIYHLSNTKNIDLRYSILKKILKDPFEVCKIQAGSCAKECHTYMQRLAELKRIIQLQYKIQIRNKTNQKRTVYVSNRINKPLISVIIPIFNVEGYIDECLQSILKQSLERIEIICIDDGSTDSSREKVIRYANSDNRITVIYQSNSGLSITRNVGMSYAKGEYIFFMDGDDILEKDALRKCYNHLKQEKLQIIYFNAKCFLDEKTTDINIKNKYNQYNKYYMRQHKYSRVYKGMEFLYSTKSNDEFLSSACFQVIEKKYLDEKGITFLPYIVHEDELYTFQTLLGANCVGFISDVLYNRRLRANSIMTKRTSFESVYGYFKVFLEMNKSIESIDSGDIYDRLIIDHIQSIIQLARNQYYQLESDEKRTYYALPLYERILFEQLIVNPTRTDTSYMKEKLFYQEEIRNIRSGYSFRTGRIITWVPRKIRGISRCLKEHGMIYTAKRLIEHFGINMGTGDYKK